MRLADVHSEGGARPDLWVDCCSNSSYHRAARPGNACQSGCGRRCRPLHRTLPIALAPGRLDLVLGFGLMGTRSVLRGEAGPTHAEDVAQMTLTALGVPNAAEVARRSMDEESLAARAGGRPMERFGSAGRSRSVPARTWRTPSTTEGAGIKRMRPIHRVSAVRDRARRLASRRGVLDLCSSHVTRGRFSGR